MKKDEETFPSEKDLAKNPHHKNKKSIKHKIKKESSEDVVQTNPSQLEIDSLSKQIAELTKTNSELEDRLLRSQAEIQNIQTRQKKELTQSLKYASQSFAKSILPAIDNLERALEIEVDDEASLQLKKGVQMTLDSLKAAFLDEGIEEINPADEKFDPTKHQAVQTVPADEDHETDTVVQVLQKGYLYKERVIRPAMVVVAQ